MHDHSLEAACEGTKMQTDLKKLRAVQTQIQQKIGGTMEGLYFPQDASVLCIFRVKEDEWLKKAGKIYFSESRDAEPRFST